MSRITRMMVVALLIAAVPAVAWGAEGEDPLVKQPGIVMAEFVFDQSPFAQCHASTIAATEIPTMGDGLVAAWFGGSREGKSDVGVWVARRGKSAWTAPVEVATGKSPNGKRYPCWNPVLFQPKAGPLLLFYKVGPSPRTWWGMLIRSTDGGRTWSEPKRLPEGIAGPIKDKPVMLDGGLLLCPSSTEDNGWRVHMESTPDLGATWKRGEPLGDGTKIGAIQPTVLLHAGGKLQILCRSRQGKIAEAWSDDAGKTWGPMTLIELPNPNSGIDAVTLGDGRHLLVYNHASPVVGRWGGPRSPLNVAVSGDGKSWKGALVLENQPGEFSYPAVIQADDGKVHITYTWKRNKVKHVVVDPTKLGPREMSDGKWPLH